jgi:hypothetical protein
MGLTDDNLSSLEEKYLHGLNYRKGSSHRDRNRKLLRIIIDKTINPDLLVNLLKDSVGDIERDFIVSVSSSEQTAIVEIPKYVLDLHKHIGGKVCFSYTCI